MKKILTIMLVALTAMGCTHNNGDIGLWFGHWHLESIDIDGKRDGLYGGHVFWTFQSSVIQMIETRSAPDGSVLDMERSWGTWSEEDGFLVLNFSHSEDSQPVGSPNYIPLPETHLPVGISRLHIDKISSSRLQLTYQNADGKVYVYRFSKQR